MIKSEERPFGMSQLDWLWLNYNYYNVKNSPSPIPSERVILTEQAIASLIQRASRGGITQLKLEDSPDEPNAYRLVGKAIDNSELTFVTLPKDEHITSFSSRKVLPSDADHGCTLPVGTGVLAITTNLGSTYLVSLQELDIPISGGETCTTITEIDKGVVTSSVKIDQQNNDKSAVEIKHTKKGLYSSIKLDNSDGGVRLDVNDIGLKAYIPLEGSDKHISFKQLTLDEYMSSTPSQGTVYFISDKPYIYLNGVRYGANSIPGESPIISLRYDKNTGKLTYKKSDGSPDGVIELGSRSLGSGGVSEEELNRKLEKVNELIEQIALSIPRYILRKGTSEDNGRDYLYLIQVGQDLSEHYVASVELPSDNFLSFAEQRTATSDDVQSARDKGVSIVEGDLILILTLTNTDKVYVKLSELVDSYVGGSTNTIRVSVDDYEVKADIRIDSKDKILFDSVRGLSGRFSVKQEGNKVSFFGKTETDTDKLGEITISDQLLSYKVAKSIDRDTILAHPPRMVDGEPHDSVSNPVTEGYSYIILTLGLETNNPTRDYKYHLYINVTNLLGETSISSDSGNIVRKGSDGFVYGSIDWIEIN